MRMKTLLLLVAAATLLASCGIPERRLRAGLINAGIHPRMAECMAHRMAERLSIAQLRRLGDLPHARRAGSIEDYLYDVRSLRDPEVVSVTATSAALCEVQRLIG